MAVETFSKADFEAALPVAKKDGSKLWVSTGLLQGEHTYSIPVNDSCAITIRSSVKSSGYSAECGKDSIRAWLSDSEGRPVGSKVQSHVTRTSGWDSRMVTMLRKLYSMGQHVNYCSGCKELVKIFKVKKEGANKGRLFTKCDCPDSFTWI